MDAGGAFFPPVGVEVFDVHGFAFSVGEVCVESAVRRGIRWEAVALTVLQVEDLGFAGAAFASGAVGAFCVGWDEEFHDDWRWWHCVVYVRFFPSDDVAFVGEDAGLGDGEFR